MSQLSHGDHVSIFKFASTGLGACILEAADYIKDNRVSLESVEVKYTQDEDGDHYFEFWPVKA